MTEKRRPMKNITLSIDERTLETVRQYAAAHHSSVNALVRDYLTRLAAAEDRASSALSRMRKLSDESEGSIGPKNWTRSDLHDR